MIERFSDSQVLIPVWQAPIQAIVIPISDQQNDYAEYVAYRLRHAGMRVQVDDSSHRMNSKIREAQRQNIPYLLIVGKREADCAEVSVWLHSDDDLGVVALEKFIAMAQEDVAERRNV